MKRRVSFNLYWAFIIIAVALICIWLVFYLPNFSHKISGNTDDWGNFGDFFWGFGIMCLTALNVYVFWQIECQFRRDGIVRDLRSIADKIRDTEDPKSVNKWIISFSMAINSARVTGLLSKDADDCLQKYRVKLSPAAINYDTVSYVCDAILYIIATNKSIDVEPYNNSEIEGELSPLEMINHLDEKTQEKEHKQDQKEEEEPMVSLADFLQADIQTFKNLILMYPEASLSHNVRIPNTSMVMDALMKERGKKDVIIEIKARLTMNSLLKGIAQLMDYRREYENYYNTKVNLALAVLDDKEHNSNTKEEIMQLKGMATRYDVELMLVPANIEKKNENNMPENQDFIIRDDKQLLLGGKSKFRAYLTKRKALKKLNSLIKEADKLLDIYKDVTIEESTETAFRQTNPLFLEETKWSNTVERTLIDLFGDQQSNIINKIRGVNEINESQLYTKTRKTLEKKRDILVDFRDELKY